MSVRARAIALAVLAIALLVVVLAAPGRPVERSLPAFGGGLGCRGVGFDATIAGDPDASPAAWLVNRSDGQRIDVTWPPNSFARFGDKLEIVLASGAVYYVEGDIVTGGCMDANGWAIKDSRYGTPPLP